MRVGEAAVRITAVAALAALFVAELAARYPNNRRFGSNGQSEGWASRRPRSCSQLLTHLLSPNFSHWTQVIAATSACAAADSLCGDDACGDDGLFGGDDTTWLWQTIAEERPGAQPQAALASGPRGIFRPNLPPPPWALSRGCWNVHSSGCNGHKAALAGRHRDQSAPRRAVRTVHVVARVTQMSPAMNPRCLLALYIKCFSLRAKFL